MKFRAVVVISRVFQILGANGHPGRNRRDDGSYTDGRGMQRTEMEQARGGADKDGAGNDGADKDGADKDGAVTTMEQSAADYPAPVDTVW